MRTHALAAVTLSILVSCPSQQQQPVSARRGLVVHPAPDVSTYLAGEWRVAETSEETASTTIYDVLRPFSSAGGTHAGRARTVSEPRPKSSPC